MDAVNKRSGRIFAVAGIFATTCSMIAFTLAFSLHQTMHGFTIRGNGPSFGHRHAQRFRLAKPKAHPLVKLWKAETFESCPESAIVASLRPSLCNTTTSIDSPTKYCKHVGQHTQHGRNVILILVVGLFAELSVNTLPRTPTSTRKRNPDK